MMIRQAGLRLCCSQTPEDRFSRIEAHMFFKEIGKKYNIQPNMTCITCVYKLIHVKEVLYHTFIH